MRQRFRRGVREPNSDRLKQDAVGPQPPLRDDNQNRRFDRASLDSSHPKQAVAHVGSKPENAMLALSQSIAKLGQGAQFIGRCCREAKIFEVCGNLLK